MKQTSQNILPLSQLVPCKSGDSPLTGRGLLLQCTYGRRTIRLEAQGHEAHRKQSVPCTGIMFFFPLGYIYVCGQGTHVLLVCFLLLVGRVSHGCSLRANVLQKVRALDETQVNHLLLARTLGRTRFAATITTRTLD